MSDGQIASMQQQISGAGPKPLLEDADKQASATEGEETTTEEPATTTPAGGGGSSSTEADMMAGVGKIAEKAIEGGLKATSEGQMILKVMTLAQLLLKKMGSR